MAALHRASESRFLNTMLRPTFPPLSTSLLLLLSAGVPALAQSRFLGIDNPRASSSQSRSAEIDFQQNLGVFGTESFESLPSFQYLPPLHFGSSGILANVTDSEPLGASFVNDFAPLSFSPPKGLFTFALETTFTFNRPINAFGTYLIGAGGQGLDLTVDLFLENTLLGTSRQVDVSTFPADADLLNTAYFGVIDRAQPFNRVTLRRNGFNSIELDSITAGHALPEGGTTAALLAVGLGGLLSWKRRQTNSGTALSCGRGL